MGPIAHIVRGLPFLGLCNLCKADVERRSRARAAQRLAEGELEGGGRQSRSIIEPSHFAVGFGRSPSAATVSLVEAGKKRRKHDDSTSQDMEKYEQSFSLSDSR